jgi:membrane protein DedA with SNARE-associated domain
VTFLPLSSAAASDAPLEGVAAWAVSVMESLGGLGAALLIGLENLFPPLPSEIILPLAGFTASQGTLGLVEVIIWCTAGSVVGAWVLYGIGALLGRTRTRALMSWLPLVKIEDVDRTEAWFDRHGRGTVFLGRMIPIFRSLISIPAGVTRMPLPLFTALTLTGSLIWNTVLILAGYWLGEQWHVVETYVGTFSRIVIVAVLAALAWFVVSRVRTMRIERRAGREAGRETGRELGDDAA